MFSFSTESRHAFFPINLNFLMKATCPYFFSHRRINVISTQRIPRGRDRILSTQRIYRGAENSSCSGAKTFYIKFVMLDLSGQNKDRRITSQPTFQVHLLGLLGKTGFKVYMFPQYCHPVIVQTSAQSVL